MKEIVVTILGVRDKCRVEPRTLENVLPGDTIKFYSAELNAKISFLDPGIINIKDWETIDKGKNIVREVGSLVNNGTYYYAVMCEHDNGEYWYAEGNTCPAMIVNK